MPTYEFGIESDLVFPDDAEISHYGAPSEEGVDDVRQATCDALRQPMGFPALSEIVVPGDQVAIAIDDGLHQEPAVLAGMIGELMNAGIDPRSITVVSSVDETRGSRAVQTSQLPAEVREMVRLVEHDPADRERLSFLGVSEDDQPIYLCREIVDADVVLPVGVMRPSDSLGYIGVHGTIFPTFADDATRQRFNAPNSIQSESELQRRRREAREANWLLGVRLTVQLIPGVGDRVVSVLAGDAEVIERSGAEQCERVWRFSVPERASLVVATIPGGPAQQSWSNFARTLDSALRVVDDDGAIAVCCDLKAKPGPSLKRLAQADSLDSVDRDIQRDRSSDAVAATQLVRTLQQVRVYLLSQLDEELVESLGVAYVADATEIVRLASHHNSCILLQNAQQAVPKVTAEAI